MREDGFTVTPDGMAEESSSPRVLVIDDDAYVRQMLVDVLEPEGFLVETAANGKEGIDLQRKAPYELVITDLFMPEKEGLETIQELRRDFPDIKIIAISGGTPKMPVDFLPVAESLGADHAIAKPFRRQELLRTIRAVIEERGEEGATPRVSD